jgi:hypothetical protein
MQFTHRQYEQMERAIRESQRIALFRRGTEYVVVPLALGMVGGHEAVQARNPVTGDDLTIRLDELEAFEIVR